MSVYRCCIYINKEREKNVIKVIYPARPASQHFFRITINLSQQGIPQFHILQIMNFLGNTKTTIEHSDDMLVMKLFR